jgi:3-oxoadipate enol-lactonase
VKSLRRISIQFCILVAGASICVGQSPPRRMNVEGLGKLAAFSHASITGDLIFVAGTLGTKADSFELVEGGVGPQTEQTLRNIEKILAGAGATLRDAVKVNVYLTDMTKFAEMNEVYIRIMGSEPPARTTVGVTSLALGAMVEIECVAQLPKETAAANRAGASGERPPKGGSTNGIFRTTGSFSRDGETIYYESTGEGKETIVFGHGYGGNHAVWFQQVVEFARDYRVVTWDQRGFGRSTNTTNEVDPTTAAGDLAALLDHLKIERAHIVGQSMGGWTALAYALDHPERVISLTLSASIGGIYTPKIEAAFDAFLQKSASGQAAGPPPIGQHPALRADFAREDLAKAFLYEQLGSLAPPASPSIPMMLRQTKVDLARLKQLKLPVQFMVGSADNIFTPEMVMEAAAQAPRSRVTHLNGAGHSGYFEMPDYWNNTFRVFLETIGED